VPPARKSKQKREEAAAEQSLPFPSPEVIREFPDRAAQWLFVDPLNLRELVQIADPDLVERLDFARARRINRRFVPASLAKFETDLLFEVPITGDDLDVWVYLLTEHKSSVDHDVALQLYWYMGEVWRARKRRQAERVGGSRGPSQLGPIVPLVFYTGSDAWREPISLTRALSVPAGFARFVPAWETLFLSLSGLTDAELSSGASAVRQALRVWRAEEGPLDELEAAVKAALDALETLDSSQAEQRARIVYFFVLLSFHRRSAEDYGTVLTTVANHVERSRFRERTDMAVVERSMAQVIADRAKEEGREQGHEEGLQEGLQEGRQEGRHEGLQEGRREGIRDALTLFLRSRFGDLESDQAARIARADAETLTRWLAAAANSRTVDEALG